MPVDIKYPWPFKWRYRVRFSSFFSCKFDHSWTWNVQCLLLNPSIYPCRNLAGWSRRYRRELSWLLPWKTVTSYWWRLWQRQSVQISLCQRQGTKFDSLFEWPCTALEFKWQLHWHCGALIQKDFYTVKPLSTYNRMYSNLAFSNKFLFSWVFEKATVKCRHIYFFNWITLRVHGVRHLVGCKTHYRYNLTLIICFLLGEAKGCSRPQCACHECTISLRRHPIDFRGRSGREYLTVESGQVCVIQRTARAVGLQAVQSCWAGENEILLRYTHI